MDFLELNYYKWYRCYHCGNNHVPGNCPFLPTINCIGDDFTRQQTYVDNFSRPSWNFEQDECWNPHVDSYSHALNPPFISYSHVQGNNFEDSEISRREERFDRLERLADMCLKLQEDCFKRLESIDTKFESGIQNIVVQVSQMCRDLEKLKQNSSVNHSSPLLSNEIEYEEVEDRDEQEVKEDLEIVIEPETCLEEIDGCLIDLQSVNLNACDSDIHVDVSVPITALYDSPITVVTLTDESQIDFIGCSLFLERHISNSLYEHILIPLKSVIACSLKLSMIEKAQVITLVDHLYCLKRNEDEVIMVFDTYD